ncbi:MAG: TonB-dependent receptor [Tannerella sp.]|nr:TonB-dependent receptor [Tannerella sp.]
MKRITGTVLDETKEPLAGATVRIVGTTAGTVTDGKGSFSLQVNQPDATVRISYLGYKTLDIALKGRSSLTVEMETDSRVLEDVVVVGYGTMAKRDLTGSVVSIAGDVVAGIPIANLGSALTGRLAGVSITTGDGAPDAGVKIRIRGGGSITQDNSPLYIVDGFPVERIDNIAATDIHSIDVLKDASSTAIYGARGANGVIIITTKSAQGGRTVVTYNGFAQAKKIPGKLDMMDSYNFVLAQYELSRLLGDAAFNSFLRYFGQPADYDIYQNIPGTDYQEEMFGRTAWGQSHNVAVTGGTDKTKFNLSLTYLDEDAVMLESNYKRGNVNFKLNHQISPKLKMDMSAYYTWINSYGTGSTANATYSQIKNAINYRPVIGKGSYTDQLTEADMGAYDDIQSESRMYDPITLVKQDYRLSKQNELTVNLALSWDILKNLTLRSEIGDAMRGEEIDRFYGPLTWTSRETGMGKPIAEITTYDRPRWRTAHTLTYKYKTHQHDLNAVAGFEAMSSNTRTVRITAKQLPADMPPEKAFSRMSYGSQEYPVTTQTPDNRLSSFFGRANYTLDDKYLFSATVRADGSTKFAPGKQWGVFPSAAVAWRAGEEDFIRDIRQIDNLKLRFSYGQAGNNRINDDMWRRTFEGTLGWNSMYAGIGNVQNLYYAYSSNVLVNPDLKWETTVTRDLGLDFGLFDNRLSGTFDVYWNTTSDLLISSPIPSYTGYAEQLRNIGQTSNRGLEFALNGNLLKGKDYSLDASFNISFNRNKVDRLDGASSKFYSSYWLSVELRETQDFLLQEGQSTGLIYGYVTDGFYTVDDYLPGDGNWQLKPTVANSQGVTSAQGQKTYKVVDNDNNEKEINYPRVGSLKLKKLTPIDPNDPESAIVNSSDRTVIGDTNPKHTGGFGFSGNWKGLDASIFFNWSYGNDVYNAQKIMNTSTWKYQYYNLSSMVDYKNHFNIFDLEGNDLRNDKEALKAYNTNASIWSPTMYSAVLHSWAVEDGSFLRLSNITLGYTLPGRWTKKVQISKVRLYATVNNAYIWTRYTGLDPEVNTRTSSPLTPGVDYSAYPKNRSFTLGTNITF